MKKLNKTKWAKPKLIVLTRGKPEEAILSYCKNGGGDPGGSGGGCYEEAHSQACYGCAWTSGS